MHKSRLGGLIIDCETDDLSIATEFWTKALGYETVDSSDPDDIGYALLKTAPDELHIELQQVKHPSRVHLDIETDDVEAEVARLEKLGAKRIKSISTWCVMEAPTGHRFCVIPAASSALGKKANTWD